MFWFLLFVFFVYLYVVVVCVCLVCFDVDGIFIDGWLYYDKDGNESKVYFVQDGLGLKLLQQYGIYFVLIIVCNSQFVFKCGVDFGIDIQIVVGDKLVSVQVLCVQYGIGLEQVVFMGDDLLDLVLLGVVGLVVVLVNVYLWIVECVYWQICVDGGCGVVCELCDILLVVQGYVDVVLVRFGV